MPHVRWQKPAAANQSAEHLPHDRCCSQLKPSGVALSTHEGAAGTGAAGTGAAGTGAAGLPPLWSNIELAPYAEGTPLTITGDGPAAPGSFPARPSAQGCKPAAFCSHATLCHWTSFQLSATMPPGGFR